MATQALAIKYRPTDFDDMTEQKAIKVILTQQLETGTIKNCYLFCGPAGCGKTTSARIFANKINNGQGNPIEMDAASNSGVDDVKEILKQAKTKSLDSEYKVFIIDECHSISNTGWQAFLKLIEEPPAKSIFIFCTTDPQKIPKTILSRVQRYDFQRISQQGIVNRLYAILTEETREQGRVMDSLQYQQDAISYIAKIADGGMRDAITLMDKCLSYSSELSLENVIKALGTADYTTMFELTDALLNQEPKDIISIIDKIHFDGKDLKQFVQNYLDFLIDVSKYDILRDFKYIQIPATAEYKEKLESFGDAEFTKCLEFVEVFIHLKSNIKWITTPKADIQATLILTTRGIIV